MSTVSPSRIYCRFTATERLSVPAIASAEISDVMPSDTIAIVTKITALGAQATTQGLMANLFHELDDDEDLIPFFFVQILMTGKLAREKRLQQVTTMLPSLRSLSFDSIGSAKYSLHT